MIKRHLSAAAGYREQITPPVSYDPATEFPYVWQYDDIKTGWNTETGGDGTSVMFIDSPQLAIAEGGSFPGLESGNTGGHASNPPQGWVVDDTVGGLVLTSGGGEIPVKPSRWNGSADDDLAPGLGDFLWGFRIISAGNSGDDTVKGSGANWPSSKYENSGGLRVKIGDNFNTQLDGLGSDSDESPFYFSPSPSNGDDMFFAYMRDVSTQNYYFWYGLVTAGATRADLQKLDAIATNAIYLKTTSPRNDTPDRRDVRFNEGTGLKSIIFDNNPIDFATADSKIGDYFEYLVSTL